MFTPSLTLLRHTVNPAISKATAVAIKQSSMPASVYRVQLTGSGATAVPSSLIVKRIAPDWPDDPYGHLREMCFYKCLLPYLNIAHPHIYYAGPEPGSDHQLIIMADIAQAYYFQPPTHVWTMAEIEPMVRHYAQFHAHGQRVLAQQRPLPWLFPTHIERVQQQANNLIPQTNYIIAQGLWPTLPQFPELVAWVLDAAKYYPAHNNTLLHNDIFPPNTARPFNNNDPIILIDWEMVGQGLPEMDLSFLFLQPYSSHRQLNRTTVLEIYWAEYAAITGTRPTAIQQQARQNYADALWALWLIPEAYKQVIAPGAAGSFTRSYWDSMLSVLGQRLQTVCQQ